MIETIFFDFDGVIVESVNLKTEAFAVLFKDEKKNNIKKIIEYHLRNTGVSRFDKFKYIYKEILKRQLDEGDFNRLCDTFASLVVENVILAPYVKGAEDFLRQNFNLYRYFLVSATPQEEIEKIVERRRIAGYFGNIFGAPRKKSDAVRDTIKKLGIGPEKTLYVGDAKSDYLAAKENGTHFVARIHNNEQIFTGLTCLKISDLTELSGAIKSICKNI